MHIQIASGARLAALFLPLIVTVQTGFAGEILTPAATTAGFTLTTFADSFPTTGCCGPLGITFPTGGGVLVADYPGNVRKFATDTDGQHATAAAVAQNYGNTNGVGLADLNGTIYMTEQGSGVVAQLNNDGTLNHNVATLGFATGIGAYGPGGILIVSTGTGGLFKVNPSTSAVTPFESGPNFDGVTVSEGTNTVYVEGSGHILGFNITTGAQVFDSGLIPDSPDGVALGTGTLAGNLFVNTNSGSLYEVNIATLAQTKLGTGGSRGDFVSVDPNGTLLLTQSDSILRLTAPAGGGFGTTTPEPGTLFLMAGSMVFVLGRFAKRRAQGA